MANQRLYPGFPFAVLVNEVDNNQRMTAGSVLVNETSGGATATVYPDSWLVPFSTPSLKAVLTVACIASGCVLAPPQVAAPPPVTLDEWFMALSEPTRPALALARAQQPGSVAPVTLPFQPMHWYQPLVEPPRPRASLGAALQLATARSFVFPVQEVITLDKWFQALALPVPPLAGLRAALQIAAAPRDPVTPFQPRGWFSPLAEPTRPKAALGPALQLVTTRNILPLQTDVRLGMWFNHLAQPIWARKPLPVADYPYWTGVLRIIINTETVTMDKWFREMNRPVLPHAPRFAAYQYVAQIMVPAQLWTLSGGLLGSVSGSVTLAGDSDAAATTLRGSTGTINLSGKVSQ